MEERKRLVERAERIAYKGLIPKHGLEPIAM